MTMPVSHAEISLFPRTEGGGLTVRWRESGTLIEEKVDASVLSLVRRKAVTQVLNESTNSDARSVGEEVSRVLFPGEVSEALEACLGRLEVGDHLCLALRVDDRMKRLWRIPWEVVLHAGRFLVTWRVGNLPAVTLFRALSPKTLAYDPKNPSSLRRILIALGPRGLPEHGGPALPEWTFTHGLEEQFREVGVDAAIRGPDMSLERLKDEIVRNSPIDLFVFLGHAQSDALLLSSAEGQGSEWVHSKFIVPYLQNDVAVAVIAACDAGDADSGSSLAQTLAQLGVTTVAFQSKVEGDQIQGFVGQFLAQLRGGAGFINALARARSELNVTETRIADSARAVLWQVGSDLPSLLVPKAQPQRERLSSSLDNPTWAQIALRGKLWRVVPSLSGPRLLRVSRQDASVEATSRLVDGTISISPCGRVVAQLNDTGLRISWCLPNAELRPWPNIAELGLGPPFRLLTLDAPGNANLVRCVISTADETRLLTVRHGKGRVENQLMVDRPSRAAAFIRHRPFLVDFEGSPSPDWPLELRPTRRPLFAVDAAMIGRWWIVAGIVSAERGTSLEVLTDAGWSDGTLVDEDVDKVVVVREPISLSSSLTVLATSGSTVSAHTFTVDRSAVPAIDASAALLPADLGSPQIPEADLGP
jgi:hypothetical protein